MRRHRTIAAALSGLATGVALLVALGFATSLFDAGPSEADVTASFERGGDEARAALADARQASYLNGYTAGYGAGLFAADTGIVTVEQVFEMMSRAFDRGYAAGFADGMAETEPSGADAAGSDLSGADQAPAASSATAPRSAMAQFADSIAASLEEAGFAPDAAQQLGAWAASENQWWTERRLPFLGAR